MFRGKQNSSIGSSRFEELQELVAKSHRESARSPEHTRGTLFRRRDADPVLADPAAKGAKSPNVLYLEAGHRLGFLLHRLFGTILSQFSLKLLDPAKWTNSGVPGLREAFMTTLSRYCLAEMTLAI